LAAKRFGGDMVAVALPFLAGISDPADLDAVDDLFLGCSSGKRLLGDLKKVVKAGCGAKANGSIG